MKKVYLLYSGNAWLNVSSLRIIAICSTKEKAVELATAHAKEDEPLDDEDVQNLLHINQTCHRDDNYLICEQDVDVLD